MLHEFKLVDLTHTITTSVPSWQGTASFSFTIIKDYHQGLRTQQFNLNSNTGTHIDAPSHIEKTAETIDRIPLSRLVVPAYVMHIPAINDDYRISVQDIDTFEKKHGKIPANCLFIAHTNWSKHWDEPQKYRNLVNQTMHFPGFSIEAAELLVHRKIAGIAIDTFSPDGGDNTFPVHKLLLSKNIYIIENITNTDKLPPTGSFVATLPLKLFDAVEAPARVIGFIPHKTQ